MIGKLSGELKTGGVGEFVRGNAAPAASVVVNLPTVPEKRPEDFIAIIRQFYSLPPKPDRTPKADPIMVNNSHDPPSLLKNYGKHRNWILLKLVGTKSNRDGIGARATVRAGGNQQLQEVRSGGGYISQSDFRLHFGLGSATKIDVLEIRWPSGLVEKLEDIPANQILSVKEGVGIVKHYCFVEMTPRPSSEVRNCVSCGNPEGLKAATRLKPEKKFCRIAKGTRKDTVGHPR
jgi:hypothetical protein